MIVSVIGNICSGKSTFIKEACDLLNKKDVRSEHAAIEYIRKEVLDEVRKILRTDIPFTWKMEDQAYERLTSMAIRTSEKGEIFFMETCGTARRTPDLHRNLKTHRPLIILKVECSTNSCKIRNKKRELQGKCLDDFPLPFRRTDIDITIEQMAPKLRNIQYDWVIDTECSPIDFKHEVEAFIDYLMKKRDNENN